MRTNDRANSREIKRVCVCVHNAADTRSEMVKDKTQQDNKIIPQCTAQNTLQFHDRRRNINGNIFTCVSYAEARNRYRLDVCPSVCLSVCLSITRWHGIKTAEYIVMISSPHDSPFILVLCTPRSSRNSDGSLNTGGV